MKHFTDSLKYTPCKEALIWLKTQPDAQTAWNKSERGDWMLFHAGKLAGAAGSNARRPLVLAACECARLALKYVKKDELGPLMVIETAERWASGNRETTLAQVRVAADTADAAAATAAYAAAAATAYAADTAAYADAKILATCSDIVRKYYPKVPV